MTKPKEFWKIQQPDYWAEVWQQASCYMRKNHTPTDDLKKTVAMWNNRASNFAKNTAREQNQARQQAVFDFLDSCGVNFDGMNVLDIGCGPGNYTLSLAKKAANVWALDPAVSMLDILKERAENEGIDNITYVNLPWEEINLKQEGWLGKFDMVFASMTPGVNDKETLEKVINASRGYCFVSKFAGQRRNNLQEKLWQQIFGEPWSDHSMDIIYPFNLVYSMGYFPSLKFVAANWINEEKMEETIEKLTDWLSGYMDITPGLSREVHRFVISESVNGLVKEVVKANIGMMVWRL